MYNMDYLRWLRELNGLQLKKMDANRKSTSKLRKHLHQFDNKCAVNTQNTEKLCKLTIQPNTEMHCKYLQHNQIQKCTANTYNTTNIETCCKFSQHNQIQKCAANSCNTTKHKNTLQILKHNFISVFGCVASICTAFLYLVVIHICSVFLYLGALWVFAVHVLSNWWRCLLKGVVGDLGKC